MAVGVLGLLQVGDVTLRPQERRLLCALVLKRGAAASPGELADACWGESPPATWYQQLKTSVARIRRALGGNAILTDSAGYSFGWELDSVDAVRFERLVNRAREHAIRGEDDRAAHAFELALALWRGRAFEDLEDWALASIEADRLAEIRATAEEEHLAVRLRLGHAADVLPDAQRLVRREPLREERWRLLALANYQSDRQAEALAVLRAGRDRLRAELGIDPGSRHRELEAAILRHSPDIAAPASQIRTSEMCPYPGLRAFTVDDAEMFFGRESEIDLLVDRLAPGEITTVAGPSGSGKSSLVRAGVLPRIVGDDRAVTVLQPSRESLTTLRSWDRTDALADVLVIDQFEELWREEKPFVDAFCAALQTVSDRRATLIVTVRSDFLDRATALPHIGGGIGRNVFAVGPLTNSDFRRAVELPAERAGLRVEPGLTELMLRDGGSLATSLPYLSHALSETWARREGNTLTVAGYEAAGGIAGAIAQSAEDLYTDLSATDRSICQSVLLRLVERTVEGASVRRDAEIGPLVEDPRRREIIDLLVSARLLSVDGSTITLTHEAIAQAWPRLDRWLQDNADGDRMLRDLQASTARWVESARSDDEVARGARLHAYLAWRQSARPDLTAAERDFLDAGSAREQDAVRVLTDRAARDRRRVRSLRWALGGAAALLIVALVSGGMALVRGSDALAAERDARTTAVAASARSLVETDRDVGALLAAELYRRDPDDPRARAALMDVLGAPTLPTTKISFAGDERLSATAVPGTSLMLVVIDPVPETGGGTATPRVEIWDAVKGTRERSLDAPLPVNATQVDRNIFIDPRGERAVVITPAWWEDYPGDCCIATVSAMNLRTGEVTRPTDELGLALSRDAAMAPDGSRLTLLDRYSGEPVWVDAVTLETETAAMPAGHDNAPFVSDAIAALPGGDVAIGERAGIRIYDDRSHATIAFVPLRADLATLSMADAGDGRLLAAGPDGLALVDVTTRAIVWQQGSVPSRPCSRVRAVSPDTALCVGNTSWELRLSDGLPTGRSFDTQGGWTANLDELSDGSVVAVNQRDAPFLVRFPLDGTGPLTRLVAEGQQAAGDFIDAHTIITSPGNGELTRWDIALDAAGPTQDGDLFVVSQGRAHLWTTDLAATVLADVQAEGGWPITGDFDEPGDQLVPVSGGAGERSFAIANDWIVPYDPRTGHITGPPIDFEGKQLHWRWVMVHEVPGMDRAVITWWDREDSQLHTASFDLTTGEELRRGLTGDVASIPLPDTNILSVNYSSLTLNNLDLEPLKVFAKPENSANVFELSDDGRTLLVEAWNGDAAIYDLPTFTKMGKDIVVASPDWESAHLSPDGSTLVTNALNGVLVWDLDPAAMLKAACRIAGRSLTSAEWATHFADEPYADACADRP
ncbi:BTAD domain-containing putative transcriptional regulator [Microbacterium sp. P02]|uniref:nSTAND1 domain-containing NTPase n=1 Tax=Microbacterium sp. P02 TaxID=3366260 RepID=UPI0036733E28